MGVVVERHAENFHVDIGAPFPALLDTLAFEGATRRNRPNLSEGDLVYARVTTTHRDIGTDLSCMDVSGQVGFSVSHALNLCMASCRDGGKWR